MDAKSIGSKIAQARKKFNVSQAQLAEKVFVSPQAVGKWERGESIPDIITFSRLAEILGVDLNYFSENYPSAVLETVLAAPSVELPSEKQKNRLSWDMSRGNWVDADFSGLKNLHDKFSSSNMKNCKFIGSEMSGLLLKGNNVEGCDFSESDISNSQIQGSNLGNNAFKNCLLKHTEFSKSNVGGCDFSGADFTKATFKSSNFLKNTFANSILNGTSFIETGIQDMVFEGAIEDCCFENCAFYSVKFQNATLVNTFFKYNRRFNRVKFINCNVDKMTYAFLKNNQADLTGIAILTA